MRHGCTIALLTQNKPKRSLDRCSNTLEVADSTKTSKCKLLFVNACECKSPISTKAVLSQTSAKLKYMH
jgi:hypothetical protein